MSIFNATALTKNKTLNRIVNDGSENKQSSNPSLACLAARKNLNTVFVETVPHST